MENKPRRTQKENLGKSKAVNALYLQSVFSYINIVFSGIDMITTTIVVDWLKVTSVLMTKVSQTLMRKWNGYHPRQKPQEHIKIKLCSLNGLLKFQMTSKLVGLQWLALLEKDAW